MKFFIDKDSEIFLFQILKAGGLLSSYNEIREAIEAEKVILNGEVCLNQREVVGHGDIVECGDKKTEVVARGITGKGKKLREETPAPEKPEYIPSVEHGRVNKWAAKPINLEKRLDTKINEVTLKLHNLLMKKELTLAFAESCTGGMLQEAIVSLPGCSSYFLGGVTAYADSIKTKVLKVKQESLDKFGAVSNEVAKEMVNGLQMQFGSAVSAAITGIAGPDGGTEEKPVGTVYTAVLIKGKLIENRYSFSGTRSLIRKKSTLEILNTIYKNS